MTPLHAARTLVDRFGVQNVSTRIGIPCRPIVVRESVSEKARRVWWECDCTMGRTAEPARFRGYTR